MCVINVSPGTTLCVEPVLAGMDGLRGVCDEQWWKKKP